MAHSPCHGGLPLEDMDADDAEVVLLVPMPVGNARAFAKRTREVVGSGHPICVTYGQ